MSSPGSTPVGMPRQALQQEQIIQTALVLLDEGGIENLSMRRLASRLGITAAALYWHVRSRHDLLLLAAMTLHPLDGPCQDRHDEHLIAFCETSGLTRRDAGQAAHSIITLTIGAALATLPDPRVSFGPQSILDGIEARLASHA
ncbi:MAG: TetR family transcriptional regulator [Streptomyces sp.]|nr:TetR family transcriptional regulator [Streptomyces sp.]